ncbi:MAG: type VI secretion system protein TssA [Desulfobacterales bacterium]|jgi:type VI secretion system protein VasJ
MEIHSLGKEPIQPDQPAGSDARYEPEYEKLQAEIDKLSSPSASGGIDWKKVSDLAGSILDKKCKDLLVASYLAVSQIHIRRIEGLTDGLKVIHDLIEYYWDDLFPPKKRMRGRLAAIEWWIEKTEMALKGITSQPIAAEKADAIHQALTQIDSLLVEHLPQPPLLRPIQRVLEEFPSVSQGQSEPDSTSTAEPPQPQQSPALKPETPRESPQTAAASDEPRELATESDAQKFITTGMQKVRQAAAFLLEHNSMNAMAYRYRRAAAWSLVSALPPQSNGQTRIPPPAPQIRQALLDLRESGNWNALIMSAEQRLSQFIFWFDLNRFSAEALAGLGNGYQQAYEAVCQETAFFIYRFPTLAELSFSDGCPFADPETRQWLNDIAIGANSVAAAGVAMSEPADAAPKTDHMANTLAKAQGLAKKKKLPQAVRLFQTELKNCDSQQEVLMWRSALCRILIGSKRTDMALPHLELILKDIETYRLVSWDPQSALEGLKLVWTGYTQHTDKEVKRNAQAVLSQIAKLDPAEALSLSKPKG